MQRGELICCCVWLDWRTEDVLMTDRRGNVSAVRWCTASVRRTRKLHKMKCVCP